MALAAVRKQLGPDDPEQVAYVANLAGVLQEKEQHQVGGGGGGRGVRGWRCGFHRIGAGPCKGRCQGVSMDGSHGYNGQAAWSSG